MRVIVSGSHGVMGGHLLRILREGGKHTVAAEVSRSSAEYPTVASFSGEADVVIDFSNHENTAALLSACVERRLPVVIATTGQTAEEKAMISSAAEQIPVFYSGNMSLGIAVLVELAKQAAKMFPDADIEIIERHHIRKADAPSGTALMLADAVREVRPQAWYRIGRTTESGKRTKDEIGIHALRYGNEVGTHEVIIATPNQVLTLKHEAENRALFAEGAVAAAEFLVRQQPGLYAMKDLTA